MSQLPRPIFTKSRTTKRPRSGNTGVGRAGGGGRGGGRPSRTPGRFHGAFEGGHSAGFFNTVGSRDGWKPTNEDDLEDDADDGDEFDEFGRSAKSWASSGAGGSSDQHVEAKEQSDDIMGSGKKRPRVWDRNRSAEDYMDDRDYEDWGGPTGVSAEYSDRKVAAMAKNVDDGAGSSQQQGLGLLVPTELLQPMAGPTDAIGRVLLRKLGWREGSGTDGESSAYVPTHNDNGGENENDDTNNNSNKAPSSCSHEALLSKKRLKKIQLSERGHSLPPAKIDAYGLGFDPFRNAPEFAAHREERRKRAAERARAAGGGGGQGRYHTSDLLDDEDGDEDADTARNIKARKDSGKRNSNNSSNVLAYETAEDFIGRTGTAGFALEDDDDDVYDNVHLASATGLSAVGGGSTTKLVGIGGEVYHTELIDHESDAEGEGSSQQAKHGGSVAFAGALSAWATGDEANATTSGMTSTTKAVTSDGRPPLDGFILGGSGGEKDSTNKRFAGPDLPPNFEPSRHVFRKEDLPEQVAEQSRKTKQEAEEIRGAKSGGSASSQSLIKVLKRDDITPMAGTAFAGLAAAMKNRFTSGEPDAEKAANKEHVGLRIPNPTNDLSSIALAVPASKEEEEKKEIEVKRSTMLWNPEPLLCKRLGVRPPSRSTTPISNQQKQTEETYFKNEILGVAGAAVAAASTADPCGDNNSSANAGEIDSNDIPIRPPQSGDDVGASRPPMDLFKSIFGASSSESDDSSSSDEDDIQGEGSAQAIGTSKKEVEETSVDMIEAQNNNNSVDNPGAMNFEGSGNGIVEKDKARKHRRRSRRSSSVDTNLSDSSDSSDSSNSYERRRRKKKSRRRKKERSRRRDDDRMRSKDERKRKKRKRQSRSRSRSRDRGRDIERNASKKSSKRTSGRDT